MPIYIEDSGDQTDSMKWDFNENVFPTYTIGKYDYIASSPERAKLLADLREHISLVCDRIARDPSWRNARTQSYKDGVKVFLGLHSEDYYDPHNLPSPFSEIAANGQKTSRYLLGEIPDGTGFEGISKPRMRYDEIGAQPVGKDGTARALYRHIFLNLNNSPKSLENLIIHELAHSMANHIFWRNDDHGPDFKWAERLIKKHW